MELTGSTLVGQGPGTRPRVAADGTVRDDFLAELDPGLNQSVTTKLQKFTITGNGTDARPRAGLAGERLHLEACAARRLIAQGADLSREVAPGRDRLLRLRPLDRIPRFHPRRRHSADDPAFGRPQAGPRQVTTATITTILLKKGLRNVWLRGTRAAEGRPAAAGRPRLHPALRADARGSGDAGILVRRRNRPGPRSRRCRKAASPWSMPRASPMPASSATSSARRMAQAGRRRPRHRRRGARHGGRARHRPAGLVRGASRRRPRSPASPSSTGRSRSAAAASPSSPTTSWSPTATAWW